MPPIFDLNLMCLLYHKSSLFSIIIAGSQKGGRGYSGYKMCNEKRGKQSETVIKLLLVRLLCFINAYNVKLNAILPTFSPEPHIFLLNSPHLLTLFKDNIPSLVRDSELVIGGNHAYLIWILTNKKYPIKSINRNNWLQGFKFSGYSARSRPLNGTVPQWEIQRHNSQVISKTMSAV